MLGPSFDPDSSSKRPCRSSSTVPASPVSARTLAAAAAATASSAHPPPTAHMDPSEPSNSCRDRRKPISDNSDKDKEKEAHSHSSNQDRDRERERKIEKTLELDDNDSEDGVGILHQNLTSAGSALQGLLRKLGAGLDDFLPSQGIGSVSSSQHSGRLKKILSGLLSDGEEGRQIFEIVNLANELLPPLPLDPHVLVPALQIADVLMEKLPDTFLKMFVREGVGHAIDQLILTGNSISGPPQASSTEKDNECISSTSSRSRRYRRRCNGANIDVCQRCCSWYSLY